LTSSWWRLRELFLGDREDSDLIAGEHGELRCIGGEGEAFAAGGRGTDTHPEQAFAVASPIDPELL
jgi:hypothetical protein